MNYSKTNNSFEVNFVIKNEAQTQSLRCPVYVDFSIVNDDGVEVYCETHLLGQDSYRYNAGRWTACAWIPLEAIRPGTTQYGDLYMHVYYPGYLDWETSTHWLYDLPKRDISAHSSLKLPGLPLSLKHYSYSGDVEEMLMITDIRYSFEESWDDEVKLNLYFSGTKTYDENGSWHSSMAKISWKLYDSVGYVVDSGTYYGPSVCTGESFADVGTTIYGLKPGKTYRLELVSNY